MNKQAKPQDNGNKEIKTTKASDFECRRSTSDRFNGEDRRNIARQFNQPENWWLRVNTLD